MKRKNRSIDVSIFLVLGLVLFTGSLIWKKHEVTKLSFVPANLAVTQAPPEIQQPTYLTIDSIQIHLPIDETVIHAGVWQVSQNSISHLATSATPGAQGNIILYGHNTKERLGNLSKVKKGTSIYLTTKNGEKHEYVVVNTQVVNPSQVEVLTAQHDEELTIYTCYGFADLKRFVVKALPVKAS